ncbi:MAG: hypothetical protein K8H88_26235, partial [Sandaracinaceae bacterium]|nr:hypothetical protein [Sandaracinaceae bacterium]
GARAGLRAVVDSESFLSEESERPSFGYTRAAVWARARFAPQGDGPWLLEVAHPQLDHLAVHVRTRSGGFRSFTTGDATPFATRPTRHRTFVFPMPEDAARPFEVYVRTTSSGSIVLPLRFFRPGEFAEHAAAAELGFGLYYAFLLAMAIYNLFLFVASREKGYLFYVSYLASFALFQAALEGHAYRWLWPEAPWLASSMTGVALALALASGCLFVRKMLELAARGDGRALRYAAIVLAASVPLFFLAYPVAIRGLTLGAVVVIVGIVVVMVRALARGERAARYLVAAFAAVVPGGLALAARQLELAPSSFWTEHLVKIGTAAEAIILSFALADRLDRLTRREAEAQAKLLVLERGFAMRELARLDEERRRLALELHDGLGQTLLALAS